MSDIGNYYGSFQVAQEYENNGDFLLAAIMYWLCAQYWEYGDFFTSVDSSLGEKAIKKVYKFQKKLPYAPISKTMFIKGCQCLKALWLYRKKYNQRFVSNELQQKFNSGHIIGLLAQQLFPSGYDASLFSILNHQLMDLQGRMLLQFPAPPYRLKQNLWLRQTQQALNQNIHNIYEAAFTYNDVFSAVDILHAERKGYVAYEVKSSFDVKDVYIHDCALQYYVMSHNLDLTDIFLVYPDEEYAKSLGLCIADISEDNCDIQKLFIRKSILNEVLSLQKTIETELQQIRPILSQKKEPNISIGWHCDFPYECEFRHYCSASSSFCGERNSILNCHNT